MERNITGVRAALPGGRRGLAVVLAAFSLLIAGLVAGGLTSASGQSPRATARSEHLTLKVQNGGQEWTVSINIFVIDPGDGSYTKRADEARKDVLGRFKGAVELDESSEPYVLSGYRWNPATAAWGYNPAGKKSGLSGDHEAVLGAAAIWTASKSNFSFTGGGVTTAGTGACTNNQANLDSLNTVGWKTQSGSILAVTCTWYTRAGFAVEFDIEIDPRWNWTTGPSVIVDLKTVMAHEFGHALGLGHSSGPCPGVLMCPTYTSGTTQHALHIDDLSGLFTIYGSALPIRSLVPQVAADRTP